MEDVTGALREQQLADWPPAVVEQLHGWRLRATPGVLRHRSRSALPPTQGALEHLDEVLERLEAFAREHDQPQAVQVFAGQSALDAELAQRGWRAELDADVMAGVVSPRSPGDVVEGLDEAWLSVHREVEGRSDVEATVREVFARLGERARFLQVPGYAVALAVDSPGRVGVYSLATVPAARGRGLGEALVRAAARPGCQTYLQVTTSNPAIGLYRRLGLVRVDGYRYRVRDQAAAASPVSSRTSAVFNR